MPPWFRFYSEVTTDRKIDRICRVTGQGKAAVIGAWAILLSLASDSPIRGAILLTEDHPFTAADLADELDMTPETTRSLLDQFESFGMIHRDSSAYWVTHWDERQFASDDSTERVRRYRERQRASGAGDGDDECNDGVTLHGRDGNAPETETEQRQTTEADTETDSRQQRQSGAAVAALLTEAGVAVTPKLAREFGHLRPDAVMAWIHHVQSRNPQPTNPPGLLIACLRSGKDPPALSNDGDWRRFLASDYAEYFEE